MPGTTDKAANGRICREGLGYVAGLVECLGVSLAVSLGRCS